MTPLTQHFTLEELTHSQVAVRFGYDNTPPPIAVTHLKMLAVLLEQVRTLLDVPLIVSSGYRSERVNLAVGGKPNSKHSLGLAADFTAPQYGSPLEVAQRISASNVLFDQLIHEFGSWVHIGIALERPRLELLTIDRLGTRAGLLEVRSSAGS